MDSEIEIGGVWPHPIDDDQDLSVQMEARGGRIHTVVIARGVPREDVAAMAEPIQGYAHADLGRGKGVALGFHIQSETEGEWRLEAPLMGDPRSLEAADDAHVITLVDAKDGRVKQRRNAPIPEGLAASLRKADAVQDDWTRHLARRAHERLEAAGRDAWSCGIKWIRVGHVWREDCDDFLEAALRG